MEVNIGIGWNEKKGRKKIPRSTNITSTFEGDWNNNDDHITFRQKIYSEHPGKGIIGYCPSEEDK